MNNSVFRLYLVFVVSFFLHIPDRIPFLGMIRFDLILVGLIFVVLFLDKKHIQQSSQNEIDKILKILFLYIIVSLPFVKWPGSVLNTGLPNFIKAVMFYYYSVLLINSEKKLKVFMVIFIACQSFRVFEPLYLHITNGYWGDSTNMAEGENLDRLAGAPHDIINSNGLAFVITSVIPFFHYLSSSSGFKFKILYFISLPLFIYSLILTASRTGFLALIVILSSILFKSRRKLLLGGAIAISAVIIVLNLSPLQKERYLSIGDRNVRGGSTATGRIEGVKTGFRVAFENPILGSGLGTSREANANIAGIDQPAHNLYAEIWQELGIIGLVIYLVFIKAIIVNFRNSLQAMKGNINESVFLKSVLNAMIVWFGMNFLFSFASYGLSSYEWYLFAGLSVVLRRLLELREKSHILA